MVQYSPRLDNTFGALADPTRRGILLKLGKSETGITELADAFDITPTGMKKHIRLLEEAGLVEATRQGKESMYSVRLQGFTSVREFIDDFWTVALGRLAALAEEDR